MKKVAFGKLEVGLLRRKLAHEEPIRADEKARQAILAKLVKAEQPNDPAVNAPMLEESLITYSRGKVVALALPNWPRYARQAADVGATIADAQIVGAWLAVQGWVQPKSQTLESVLRNWSGWLGKARASTTIKAQAGFNGADNLGQGASEQRPPAPRGRAAPGFR